MSEQGTREAYAERAEEYARLLGSVEQMAVADRRRIEEWAGRDDGIGVADGGGAADVGGAAETADASVDPVGGPDSLLLDLGCGPGHWTAHLAARGHHVVGIDPVPTFVDLACRTHPGVQYRVGDVLEPGLEACSCAGVLAWYSLIHLAPERMPDALASIARLLRPGGTVLLGFFDGPRIEPFDHAITTAHFWPAAELGGLLEELGFTVTGAEQRTDAGARAHGAIEARKAG